LINLRHSCISAPIGFVFGIESASPRELKIVRLYFEGYSLAEVLSVKPVWWTSTVKAKAIAGIVLGLRFAHSLGLVNGGLTANNIVFGLDHCNVGESEERTPLGGFPGEVWRPKVDIQAFASILFEIVVGQPAEFETSVPADAPDFISAIINPWVRNKNFIW
jgi:hypothetical protein